MTDEPDDHLARHAARFRETYTSGAPFAQDRALAGDLSLEARPVLEALLFASASGQGDDVHASEHREGLAMLTLLGRRAGVLGATPTAALAIVPALRAALEASSVALSPRVERALAAVCIEGYVAGREERIVREAADRAARTQTIVRVAPRCLALFLTGEHEAEALHAITDRLGRSLLADGAEVCVVDITGLERADPSCAAEVFAVDVTARMLGTLAIFTGVTDEWRRAAESARVPLELLTMEPSFEAGLKRALQRVDLEIRKPSRLFRSWRPG